jgi:hypothetical protein
MSFVHICPLCGEQIKDGEEYDSFQAAHEEKPTRNAHAKCLGAYYKSLNVKRPPQ